MDQVILVDQNDQPIGVCNKLEAHRKAYLHRAFSVFLFNNKGELLLQRRARSKYHSGGLWSNTVCSHPKEGETTVAAAQKRLEEEMNIDGKSIELNFAFSLIYNEVLDNELTEHEFDHIYIGQYNQLSINVNKSEVESYQYKSTADIARWLDSSPEDFTAWFRIIWPKLLCFLDSRPVYPSGLLNSN